jgi:CheY-like chemotaxis protein
MSLDFSRLKVLIIDDNAFMRQLLRELLWALDCQPGNMRFAANGRDGLETLRDSPTDLVICDINMRPVNGKQFTQRVRTSPDSPDPYVPIIICTAHAEVEHIYGARDSGANEILRKPLTAGNMYERIRAVVERPRPFIHCPAFNGPDRRRQTLSFEGPDRRSSGPVIV